jgi:hypothetical protein
LADRVIASHYAQPVARVLAVGTILRSAPSADSNPVTKLKPGDPFAMLDNSIGWAWGYGGPDRLVGYVESEAIAKP